MKVEIEVKILAVHERGNNLRRLIFVGAIWKEWDITFCIHGEKLRWGCDYCDEYFEKLDKRR